MNAIFNQLASAVVVGSLAIVAVGALSAGGAHAEGGSEHPDFAWWPSSKPGGTRLYVGNLTWDTTSATVQYNPKELPVSQSVPWQK
jgi:hypothetical protein